MTERRVVVGVDGTPGSHLALQWALREAGYRGDSVHAVSTWHWEGFDESAVMSSGAQVANDRARQRLDEEVDKVLAEWTEALPQVTREVTEGRPDEVLVAAAEGAEMLVIGSHGHSSLRHRAFGSVTEHCIQRATCPVVVVPLPH